MIHRNVKLLFTFLIIAAASLTAISCKSAPTDPRTAIPADALIYLETRDLGQTVAAFTDNETFRAASAGARPDTSAIDGIRMSVAITGFETAEQPAGAESAVLQLQPHFVAVAETNAWSFQTERFAANQLGEFINDVYGGGVELGITSKDDGKYFTWTAKDGRKAFAFLQGSLIFFGNDESSIEKARAVRRGEADSITKSGLITDAAEQIASGFVSPDGVAQIASLVGISVAMNAGESDDVKSFIARVLPEILRGSVKEIKWSAVRRESGIEDRYDVALSPEAASAFAESMIPATGGSGGNTNLEDFVPADRLSVTLYNLKDPLAAWQSVLGLAGNARDPLSSKLVTGFASSLFEPYAVENGELFLSSVGGRIVTVKLDPDGQNAVAIANVLRPDDVKKSLAKEINFGAAPEKIGDADVWKSPEGDAAAAFVGGVVIVGDAEDVRRCLDAARNSAKPSAAELAAQIGAGDAAAVSVQTDAETPSRVADLIGERDDNSTAENAPPAGAGQRVITATSFDRSGMRRRTISDFGLFGTIISQFSAD